MDAYGGEKGLQKAETKLISPPKVEVTRGMIFASLDPEAVPLEESLGGFGFYLDLYMNHSEEGMEVRGPQRWIVQSNWKIGAENFAGDSYHTPQTHISVIEIGLFLEPKANRRKEGALYWADGGGGTTYKLPTGDFDENMAYIGYPEEMIKRIRERWSPEQQKMVGEAGFMVSASTIFPNLSFVHNWPRVREGEDVEVEPLPQWPPFAADTASRFRDARSEHVDVGGDPRRERADDGEGRADREGGQRSQGGNAAACARRADREQGGSCPKGAPGEADRDALEPGECEECAA